MLWLLLSCSEPPLSMPVDPPGGEAPASGGPVAGPGGATPASPSTEPSGEMMAMDRGVPVRQGALSEGVRLHGTVSGSQLAQVRFQVLEPDGSATVMVFVPAIDGAFEALAPAGFDQPVYVSAAELPKAGFTGPTPISGALAEPLTVGSDDIEIAFAMGDTADWAARMVPRVDEVVDPRYAAFPEPDAGAPPTP